MTDVRRHNQQVLMDTNHALERHVDAVLMRLARHGRYPVRAEVRDALERLPVHLTMLSDQAVAGLVEVGFMLGRGGAL